MKRLIYTTLCVVASMIGVHTSAQIRSSYFMEGSYFRNELNPALAPTRGYVAIPMVSGLGVEIDNNFLTVSNFVYKNGNEVVTAFHESVSADKFLRKLPNTAAFYYVPTNGTGAYWTLLILQILVCILTGVISPLIWSMYADISDYAELKFKTASTGLIFSSSSMAQKFGGALGGAAVMWLLSGFGFNTENGAIQTEDAIEGLRLLMSWIPAGVAALSALFIFIYPLNTKCMKEINNELHKIRQ